MNVAQFPQRGRRDSPAVFAETLRQAAQMVEDAAYAQSARQSPQQIAHLMMIAANLARIADASAMDETAEVSSVSY